MNRFLLFYSPDAWKTRLDSLFKQKSRIAGMRHYYRLDASTRSWNILDPKDLTLPSHRYLHIVHEIFEEPRGGRRGDAVREKHRAGTLGEKFWLLRQY